LVLILPALAANAQTAVGELARRIRDAGLDPEECYQVRDLRFNREDARIYLTEGYLIFGKAVDGQRFSAVFSADIEGGDAEMLVMPPHRSERLSLASFSGSPTLSEHFHSAVLVFSDDTYPELLKLINAHGSPRKRPEKGAELAQNWDAVVHNISRSFQVRLVKDVLGETRASSGFFYSALIGQKLGNFDFMYDPLSPEQIAIGQVAIRYKQGYFDLWTRFQARSFRNHTRPAPPEDAVVSNYRIDAALDPELKLHVTTRVTLVPGRGATRAIQFDISPQMQVTEASIAGEPAEVFQPDSVRASLIRGESDQSLLVIPSKPLEAGREYEVEMKHSGSVVSDAGNGVYFVGARGSWYPHKFPQFARYELAFRYPKDLDLVATGKVVEESEDGDWRIARHRIETPVRMAGFNVGRFEHRSVSRAGYTVDVYANRGLEEALQPQRHIVVAAPPSGPPGDRRWTVDLSPFPDEMPKLKPTARLEQLALEITSGLEFMAGHFGPPVLKNLTVSPIPGTFGQGFPGLIYLSTLAYLDPRYRPAALQTEMGRMFYSDIMHAHETAHQWWGNLVASASGEDDWMMEALANYSALLYLEKHKGPRSVDQVLAEYRTDLLKKTETGGTVESTGPIIWGGRLNMSKTPDAWRVITYEKGSWIIHMLRRRLGDDRFLEMLGQLRRQYQYKTVSTDQFRAVAAEALPPKSFDPQLEAFFEQWVYSTGVPSIKMTHTVQGKAPNLRVTGTITQTDAPDDFSTSVPVEIQFPKSKPIVQWVKTANGPVPFSVPVRQAPSKVVLDPGDSVLRK
jgi:hypothetical protein